MYKFCCPSEGLGSLIEEKKVFFVSEKKFLVFLAGKKEGLYDFVKYKKPSFSKMRQSIRKDQCD